jgi:uncharacterized membrane-anchored protein YhcB (DUF1043 family)
MLNAIWYALLAVVVGLAIFYLIKRDRRGDNRPEQPRKRTDYKGPPANQNQYF